MKKQKPTLDSHLLACIGGMMGRNIVGVDIASLDKIMVKDSNELRVVVKDSSSPDTIDDLKGNFYTDLTSTVNVRTETVILLKPHIEKLKIILDVKKKNCIEFKTLRYTYKSTEVMFEAPSSEELIETLVHAHDFILRNQYINN
jgi:hypothetical protein